EKLLPTKPTSPLSRWRKHLFILMSNNALDATEFFRIPPNPRAREPRRTSSRLRRCALRALGDHASS
ncbi:MAG: KUP/HAK/KT family potassium transporter, partial [Gammaproteobacteria bacterium]